MGDKRKIGAFSKKYLSLLAKTAVVYAGLLVLGQGCAEFEKSIQESQRERELRQQMKLAEEELRRGNLLSAQTLLASVGRESKRLSLQERALFYSGFSILLDKTDANRWKRAQSIFAEVNERFPEGEFNQISAHFAAALSDVLATMKGLQKEIASMQRTIDRKMSQTRKTELEQEKQLSTKTEEIAALKNAIQSKNKEIKSLQLKIKKLEEIHKEIKKKRKGLS